MPRGKKRCPSCNVFVGARSSSCNCGFKFQKPTQKQESRNKKPQKLKINKKQILLRLVEVPNTEKRFFYAREMKMLNDLCNRYSLEFMDIVSFEKRFDSLAYLVSPKLRNTLDQKFRAFNYVVDKTRYPTYTIGEKCGDDKKIAKKIKTTKDFLDER
jgi:hypothetical protein